MSCEELERTECRVGLTNAGLVWAFQTLLELVEEMTAKQCVEVFGHGKEKAGF